MGTSVYHLVYQSWFVQADCQRFMQYPRRLINFFPKVSSISCLRKRAYEQSSFKRAELKSNVVISKSSKVSWRDTYLEHEITSITIPFAPKNQLCNAAQVSIHINLNVANHINCPHKMKLPVTNTNTDETEENYLSATWASLWAALGFSLVWR